EGASERPEISQKACLVLRGEPPVESGERQAERIAAVGEGDPAVPVRPLLAGAPDADPRAELSGRRGSFVQQVEQRPCECRLRGWNGVPARVARSNPQGKGGVLKPFATLEVFCGHEVAAQADAVRLLL